MNENLIIRNGQPQQIWQFRIVNHYFNTALFVLGTHDEVRDYIDSEIPNWEGSYSAISEEDYNLITRYINVTLYIAPKKN